MGIFEKFIRKESMINYPNKAGKYLCEFDKILYKQDESNETLIFLFMGKYINRDNEVLEELYSVSIKFNFYNKSEKASQLFIKSIYRILNCYTEDEEKTKEIISDANSLGELKEMLTKYIGKDKKVIIELKEKIFQSKKYYLVDLLEEFIYRENDIIEEDSLLEEEETFIDELEDLPF